MAHEAGVFELNKKPKYTKQVSKKSKNNEQDKYKGKSAEEIRSSSDKKFIKKALASDQKELSKEEFMKKHNVVPLNETGSKGGCVKLILAGIGFLLILSPLNPFVEWNHIGEEEYLTNSSWLVVTAMLFGYGYLVIKWLSNKD